MRLGLISQQYKHLFNIQTFKSVEYHTRIGAPMARAILKSESIKKLIGEDCLSVLRAQDEIPEKIVIPSKEEVYEVSRLFKLISSEPKLEILALLSQTSLPVCAISKLLQKDQSLVSHHLSELRMAGLVREKRSGRFKVYSIDKENIEGICSRMQKLIGTSQLTGTGSR